ncbi:hypothetical protein, partial [Frankia sp. CiP1_Cm_nod2]|uniref:hypothetical protein n=1 Tax=Frankia sp. CiP1_Cm_nod2 TaxID=2897161 RepID=UPI00202433E6
MVDLWDSLPDPVREAVGRHLGPVGSAAAVDGGRNNDLTAVVYGEDGPVFVKAVRGVSMRMRWLRNEVTAGTLAAGIAPAVAFAQDVTADDDWLIVGFEYLPGRSADLTPGSADLPTVGRTLDRLGGLPAPGVAGLHQRWTVRDWWSRLCEIAPDVVSGWDVDVMDRWTARAPEAVAGDRLVHTDLHGDQFVIGAGESIHVIDWGWPAAGAEWVDSAFMIIRLVEAGHSPRDAEAWAAT